MKMEDMKKWIDAKPNEIESLFVFASDSVSSFHWVNGSVRDFINCLIQACNEDSKLASAVKLAVVKLLAEGVEG